MDSGLKGKVVIVAGASQGMGRATAQAFASEGAVVAICARTDRTLQTAADQIRQETSAQVFAKPVDVGNPAQVKLFVGEVAKKFGRVDVCVANAAGPAPKTFLDISTDEWQSAFAMNFMSVVHLAREVIPHMQKSVGTDDHDYFHIGPPTYRGSCALHLNSAGGCGIDEEHGH